jgi:hypothetical protein
LYQRLNASLDRHHKRCIIIFRRIHPGADRRRYHVGIGILLDDREGGFGRAREPRFPILHAQDRWHAVLDVVYLGHELVGGHRHDGAGLDGNTTGAS